MAWRDDLWLNEGFAAYMEHAALQAVLPIFDMWDQYTVDAMAAAQRLDALRTSHPIQVPINHAEEVEQVFDAISYCKGSTAVRMVSCCLGKEKFREGLQKYMKQYAYGNTKTIDLWNAWSEVSGKDVANIMGTWTSQMGYPVVTVESFAMSNGKISVTLSQQWFLSDGSELSAEDKAKTWTIPLLFATKGATSSEAVLMTEKSQTFEIPCAADNYFLKINAGQEALARVMYTSEMAAGLSKAISAKDMSPVDRAAVLQDAYACAKAQLPGASFEVVVDVLKAFKNEQSYVVWKAMAGVLSGMDSVMEEIGGSAYTSFTAFAAGLVKETLAVVGWEDKAGEAKMDKVIYGMDGMGDTTDMTRTYRLRNTITQQNKTQFYTTYHMVVAFPTFFSNTSFYHRLPPPPIASSCVPS
jgi:puromycin-sensitive aminopeptidase